MASGTGLLNARTLAWEGALLDRCRLTPGHLNDLSEAPVACSRRRAFPALAAARWYPALGDGAARNLGSGATVPGLDAINVGTSAALRVMRAGPVRAFPFGLFCYRVDAERHLIGGAVSNAGNLRAWCIRELRLDDAQVEPQLAARPLPRHGLTVLPFWSAERAPTWDEDRRGRIDGLTFSTTALDILQALTEASYYRIALIADLIVKQERRRAAFHRLRRHPAFSLLAAAAGEYPGPPRLSQCRARGIDPRRRGLCARARGRRHRAAAACGAVRPQAAAAAAYKIERRRHGGIDA